MMSGFLTAEEAAECRAILGIKLSSEAPSASAGDVVRVLSSLGPDDCSSYRHGR